jgi:hypothetical protein
MGMANHNFCPATLLSLPKIISKLAFQPAFSAWTVEPCLQTQGKINADAGFAVQYAERALRG